MNNNYNLGRTATHEIGHFLGLLHVWGEGASNSKRCAQANDFCGDTPPVNASTSGCPAAGRLACDGQKAMIENYLDYSYDRCMNIFTQEQIARMRYVLETSPKRKSLLTSPGLETPSSLSVHLFGETNGIRCTVLANEILIDFLSSAPPTISVSCFTMTGTSIPQLYCTKTSESQLRVGLGEVKERMFFLKLAGDNVLLTKRVVLND